MQYRLHPFCCYRWRKFKKSESKSQLLESDTKVSISCYRWRKFKKSESKSQLSPWSRWMTGAVIAGVNINSLKATCNHF